MANNQVVNQNGGQALAKPSFSNFMAKVGNRLIENTLTDPKRRNQFIANIVSAVSSNPKLGECDQASIVSAGLQAEVLHFPINNSFGYAYLIPFQEKKYNPQTRQREVVRTVAQFQIGYKGYIQLAIRSGQYKKINVVDVKDGEIGIYDPLTDTFTFNWETDYNKRKQMKTIGYVGYFELSNGFEKYVYFTYEEMLDHANTYSQAFDASKYQDYINGKTNKADEWKYSSFWYKDFDEMAKKTVLRQMLSKWGIMSVEMQEAYVKDQAAIDESGRPDYIDVSAETKHTTPQDVAHEQEQENSTVDVDLETGEVTEPVQEAPTQDEPMEDDWAAKYEG